MNATDPTDSTDILLQPTRFRIAIHLMTAKEPKYIEQIANAMRENPRLIAHHLEILEDLGLVTSEFRIIEDTDSKRGFAGRFFAPTPKLRKVLESIGSMVAVKQEEGK